MNLQQRVSHAILISRKRPGQIAEEIGVTPSTVSQWMKGRIKALEAANATRLALATGVRAHWLATGEGAMMSSGNTEPGPDLHGEIPLIDWVTAGSWNMAADPLPPGQAERWLPCPAKHSAASFALRVRGDSMTAPHGRSYPEGCIIYVDPDLRSPTNGQRVIAKLEDGEHYVTFKVFKEEDGRRWLAPLNPQHEAIREPFSIIGTVVGMWMDE